MFEELIEVLVQYFSKPPYEADFKRAREAYIKMTGMVVEEHQYFDTWISGFFEWYLIDYPMINLGVSPIFLYQRIFAEKLDRAELEFLKDLEKSKLEFNEVVSASPQKVKVRNFFSKEPCTFFTQHSTALLQSGDYLITRIVRSSTRLQSFGVFWHFTNELTPLIQKRVTEIKTEDDRKEFILELVKRKTQSEIYSHVPLDHIFSWKADRIHSEAEEKI